MTAFETRRHGESDEPDIEGDREIDARQLGCGCPPAMLTRSPRRPTTLGDDALPLESRNDGLLPRLRGMRGR